MKKLTILFTSLAIFLCFDANAQRENGTLDDIIGNLYSTISGEAGVERDWAKFQRLFAPYASINALRPDDRGLMNYYQGTVSEYMMFNEDFFKNQSFYEKEVHRVVDEYNGLAQVFSTFESRAEEDGEISERGINSIQLVYFEGRWFIVNVTYTVEAKMIGIPDKYLK